MLSSKAAASTWEWKVKLILFSSWESLSVHIPSNIGSPLDGDVSSRQTDYRENNIRDRLIKLFFPTYTHFCSEVGEDLLKRIQIEAGRLK